MWGPEGFTEKRCEKWRRGEKTWEDVRQANSVEKSWNELKRGEKGWEDVKSVEKSGDVDKTKNSWDGWEKVQKSWEALKGGGKRWVNGQRSWEALRRGGKRWEELIRVEANWKGLKARTIPKLWCSSVTRIGKLVLRSYGIAFLSARNFCRSHCAGFTCTGSCTPRLQYDHYGANPEEIFALPSCCSFRIAAAVHRTDIDLGQCPSYSLTKLIIGKEGLHGPNRRLGAMVAIPPKTRVLKN